MTEHFENNIENSDSKEDILDSEYRKNYGQGYAACVYGKSKEEVPFKDPESSEAKAWYNGYNDAEIAILEKMYKK